MSCRLTDAAIFKLHAKIYAKRAQLLIIGSNPVLNTVELMSLKRQWFQFDADNNDRKHAVDPMSRFYLGLDRHLLATLAGRHGLHYFSTAHYLCEASDFCRLRYDGKLIYKDSEHINGATVDLFYADLLDTLKGIAITRH